MVCQAVRRHSAVYGRDRTRKAVSPKCRSHDTSVIMCVKLCGELRCRQNCVVKSCTLIDSQVKLWTPNEAEKVFTGTGDYFTKTKSS